MLVATFLVYLSLAGCAILALVLVVQYDLHRREPWPIMLAAIVLGAAAMLGCMRGQEAFIMANQEMWANAPNWKFALLAGACEEAAKLLVVVLMALLFRRHFDEAIDGLIYGALVGLGAAIVESIKTIGAPDTLVALPREEPIRLLGHLVMGGIGGFGIGLVRRVSVLHVVTALSCFVIAATLHVTWDTLAYRISELAEQNMPPHYGYTAISIALMLFGFFLFKFLVGICQRYDRAPPAVPAPATIPPHPENRGTGAGPPPARGSA